MLAVVPLGKQDDTRYHPPHRLFDVYESIVLVNVYTYSVYIALARAFFRSRTHPSIQGTKKGYTKKHKIQKRILVLVFICVPPTRVSRNYHQNNFDEAFRPSTPPCSRDSAANNNLV